MSNSKEQKLLNISGELGLFLLWSHCPLLLSLSFSFLPNYLITVLRISRWDVSGEVQAEYCFIIAPMPNSV